jgi:membrane-associated protein
MDWINDLDTSITHVVSWASTINPWYCVLAVLVVLSLETSLLVGLLVPGEAALLLGAGVLGIRWAVPLFGAAVAANLIGQTGGYWLGRAVGPGIRRTWLGRKIGERRWESAEAIVRGSGGRALITTRFVAVVHAVVPAVVGTLRLPFRRFLGLAAIGATAWAAVLTAAAVALGEAARVAGYGWMAVLLTCLGGGGAVVVVARAIRQRRRERAPQTSVGPMTEPSKASPDALP